MLGGTHARRAVPLCRSVHFGGHSGCYVNPQLVKGAKRQAHLGGRFRLR